MPEASNLSAVAETVGTVKGVSVIFNNFVIALFILVVGFFLGKFLGKLVSKVLKEITFDKLVKKLTKRNIPAEQVISFFVSSLIYLVALVLAFKQLGIAEKIFEWIGLGLIILVLVSFALSVRDLIPNFIAGVSIITRKKIKVGDHIKVDGVDGDVVKIELLETRVKTAKGDLIYIPNSTITKSKIEIRKKV